MAAGTVGVDAAAQLVAGIRSRVAFVSAQVGAGLGRDALLSAQVTAIVASITQAGALTLPQATTVTSEISTGPWTDAQKVTLATAISTATAGATRGSGQSRSQQHCTSVHRLFNAKDWECFQSADASWDLKAKVMGHRLWMVGLTCPSEDVLKRGGAIIVATTPPSSHARSAEEKAQLCKNIRAKVKLVDLVNMRTHPFPHVTVVGGPENLSNQLKEFAYQGDLPVDPPLADAALHPDANGIAYRKTHCSIRAAPPLRQQPQQLVLAGSPQQQWPTSMSPNFDERMMPMMQAAGMLLQSFGMVPTMGGDGGVRMPGADLASFRPRARGNIPLPDAPRADAHAPPCGQQMAIEDGRVGGDGAAGSAVDAPGVVPTAGPRAADASETLPNPAVELEKKMMAAAANSKVMKAEAKAAAKLEADAQKANEAGGSAVRGKTTGKGKGKGRGKGKGKGVKASITKGTAKGNKKAHAGAFVFQPVPLSYLNSLLTITYAPPHLCGMAVRAQHVKQ